MDDDLAESLQLIWLKRPDWPFAAANLPRHRAHGILAVATDFTMTFG
jgi:hypothetical protein